MYKLKKAFSLNVTVVVYCAVCYKEVTGSKKCDNETHQGICYHMIFPFEDQLGKMVEGAYLYIL